MKTITRDRRRHRTSMRLTAIVALVPLLASCASSGLYNMSDDWCATHLLASTARCPDHRQAVADNGGAITAAPAVAHTAD
jgi:hypothetical protein